jgi:hypothetical protein
VGIHEGDLAGGLLYWKDMFKRYIKRDGKLSFKRESLSIGTLLGNLEGIRLPGLFARKG